MDYFTTGLALFLRRHGVWSLVSIAVPLVLLGWTLGSARSPAMFPLDLIPTYIGAKLWLAGSADAVYHAGAWLPPDGGHAAWLEMLDELKLPPTDTAFVYSPVYLALVLPFVTIAKPLHFFWVYAILTAICSLFIGWESTRLAGIRRPLLRVLVTLATAFSFPCAYAAMLGQNTVIMAALVLLGFRFFQQGQPWRGGSALVLACAFKPWAVALLFVLALGRKWRAFAAAMGAYLAVFVALPHLLFPAALIDGYERVMGNAVRTSVLAFNNMSLRALIERLRMGDWTEQAFDWANHGTIDVAGLVLEALVVVPLLIAFVRVVQRARPDFERLYIGYMAFVLLFLGVCWSHYLCFAIPLVCVAIWKPASSQVTRVLAALLGVWMLWMMAAAAPPGGLMRPQPLWALAFSAPLLLAGLLAFRAMSTSPRAVHAAGSSSSSAEDEEDSARSPARAP